jgi:hypothetical protein
MGNDALSFSGSTRPSSSVWDWVETFDPSTMSTINSQCPGGGSIPSELHFQTVSHTR